MGMRFWRAAELKLLALEVVSTRVWLFMCGYLDKGIKAASDNIRNNRKVYPLAKVPNPSKMAFTNISGKVFLGRMLY